MFTYQFVLNIGWHADNHYEAHKLPAYNKYQQNQRHCQDPVVNLIKLTGLWCHMFIICVFGVVFTWQKPAWWTHTASWRFPELSGSLEAVFGCRLELTVSQRRWGCRVHPACVVRRHRLSQREEKSLDESHSVFKQRHIWFVPHRVCCLSSTGSPKNLLLSRL